MWQGREMVRRIGLAVLVAVPAAGGLQQAEITSGAGAGNGPIRTQIISQGVQFSISLPHPSYPRHALVRATLTVRNLRSDGMNIRRYFNVCPDDYGAIVQDQQAVVDYPGDPRTNLPLEPNCRYQNYPVLNPGQMTQWHMYLVLHGPVVRGQIEIGAPPSSPTTRPGGYLTTPPLTVHLTREDAPAVQIKVAGNQLSAQVHSPVPVTGPLVYTDYAFCQKGESIQVTPTNTPTAWQTSAHKDRILSGQTTACSPPQYWDLLAGWLGHSVARVRYGSPRLPWEDPRPPMPSMPKNAGAHPVTTSKTVNGVQLSLTLPGRSYPSGALIRGTIYVHNPTGRMALANLPYYNIYNCIPRDTLGFKVENQQGVSVYPPDPVTQMPTALSCGFFPSGTNTIDIRPKTALRWNVYILLAGPTVSLPWTLRFIPSDGATETPLAVSVTFHLTPEDTPDVHLQTANDQVSVQVHSPVPVSGPLMYMGTAVCPTSGLGGGIDWTAAHGNDLIVSGYTPDCPPRQHWNLLVGWLGHSVARVQYPGPSS